MVANEPESLTSTYPEDLVGLEEPHVVELINDGGGAGCCGLHGGARSGAIGRASGAWAKSAQRVCVCVCLYFRRSAESLMVEATVLPCAITT